MSVIKLRELKSKKRMKNAEINLCSQTMEF